MSKEIAVEEAIKVLGKLERAMRDVLEALGDDCDNVMSSATSNLDENFKRDEMRGILSRMELLKEDIGYLQRPISLKGRLRKNENGRFELDGGELTSGHVIEVLVKDSEGEWCWVKTTVVHDGWDYCAKAFGKHLALDYLEARCR